MTEGFQYDEAAAAREEANYRTPTAKARRAFVREQLALNPEESALSVGCGPGFEPARECPSVPHNPDTEIGIVQGARVKEGPTPII